MFQLLFSHKVAIKRCLPHLSVCDKLILCSSFFKNIYTDYSVWQGKQFSAFSNKTISLRPHRTFACVLVVQDEVTVKDPVLYM